MLSKHWFGPSFILLAGLGLAQPVQAVPSGTLVALGEVETVPVKDLNLQYRRRSSAT